MAKKIKYIVVFVLQVALSFSYAAEKPNNIANFLPDKDLPGYLKYLESNNYLVNHPIDFFKEIVNITINNDEVTVDGKYFIRSNSLITEKTMLYYPFPIENGKYEYPHSISVYESEELEKEKDVQYIKRYPGIICDVNISSNTVKYLRFCYKQKIIGKEAVLILTTARVWFKNIEYAEFIVNLPSKTQDVNLSYAPNKIEKDCDRTNYYVIRENFVPEQDLVVKWKSQQ
ncbi:MAG: hypothetical protein WC955_09990 [Elusimicrobiota bacterium]